MIKSKKKWQSIAVYLLFFVFYLWMAGQIPYTHDDWDWGLDIGITQWITASINSRYVGNFFEVVMTRSEVLKTIIMGTGFFLLPLIITEIVFSGKEADMWKERMIGFILCNTLILSMNDLVWQQTYGWVAGYANFGISAIVLCVIVKQFLEVFSDSPSESNGFHPRLVMLFFVCLAGQLFIENLAIYVFLASLVINYFHWHRTRRFLPENVTVFFASLIGLIIMFSSSMYKTLWSTGEAIDGYRQLVIHSGTDLRTIITGCIDRVIRVPYKLYTQNTSVCIAIILMLSFLLMQKQAVSNSLKKTCVILNGGIAICLLLYIPLGGFISSATGVLFFAAVTLELILLFRECRLLLYKLFFIWSAPVFIILPLVVTSELGPRLFWGPNVMLILLALFLLRRCLNAMPKKWFAAVSVAVITSVCVLLIHHGLVYHAIGECKDQREAIIETAAETGATAILLPQYPYQDYLWFPDPYGSKRESFFKDFYNIPQDVSIIFEEK